MTDDRSVEERRGCMSHRYGANGCCELGLGYVWRDADKGIRLGWVYAYRVPYSNAQVRINGGYVSGRVEMEVGWVPYMHHPKGRLCVCMRRTQRVHCEVMYGWAKRRRRESGQAPGRGRGREEAE